ncbi:fructoselysine 6-kinase [Shimazuella sp. AN120528]|nr:fructoselysine 6-kinase [Shimazuella soli]MCH5586042.1 fructoselysine 6-kinase [Shimazuella soli]
MKLVSVGDNCMDVYRSLGISYPGGNAVNVAVYARQCGATTSYVGFVGSDDYGEQMQLALKEKEVDISHLHRINGNTAVTQVELKGSERVFGEYHEGVMNHFTLDEDDLRYIEQNDVVHSGFWGRAEKYFPRWKDRQLITSFDFADKLEDPVVRTVIPSVQYAFFSYRKDDAFIRSYLREMHQLGAKVVVATLGENGSLAYDGKSFYRQNAKPVEVIDTMGAGDAYIAGFLVGIMHQKPIEKCVELGSQKAAETITYFGAW